ncbi:MAG TPA: MFS transporter [Candidatus Limnocylindrales bacterium]|nr:MFS transporter [Candidatus Limnocylindrales bacterium]
MTAPVAFAGDAAAARLTVRDQLALSALWFALNFQSAALLPIVIPAQVLLFVNPGAVGSAQQAVFLAWLGAIGAIASVVTQPIAGALSDRSVAALGRRRPYVLLGGIVMLLGAAAMGLSLTVGVFLCGYILYWLANNALTAAYQGLLPDLVPSSQRGTASGYLGLMTILGNIGSLGLAAVLLAQVGAGALEATVRRGVLLFFTITSLVVIAGIAVTLAGVRESPLSRPAAPPALTRERIVQLFLEPLRHGNFRWVFWTRGLVMLGLTLFLTFIEYYFASVARVPNFVASTASLALLALMGATGAALVVGIYSDRIGRVRLVSVSTSLMALAALVFVIAPQDVPLWPLGILFGVGYGAYTSTDWALAVDALPALSAAGKDMGIWSISSTLPPVLAPLLGGLVIGTAASRGQASLGYRAVFALAALFLLMGAVLVFQVREAPAPRP